MSTAIRTHHRDDAEVGLLEAEDSDDERLTQHRNANSQGGFPQMWPRDMVGRNLEAKMGSVAGEKVSIRLAFLRKVFGILTFQIILTTAICAALYMTPGMKTFIQTQSWVVFPSLFASMGLLIAMHFHAHNVPINYILLISFTTVQALTLGCIVSMFELQVILEAVLLTSVIVFSLFIYTLQSKRDFVKHYALGFSLIGILLMASILQIIFMSSAFNLLINVVGAGIFCFLLVLDIDMIMHHLSPEDYILACITLYMDIINLFIRILQILNEAQR